jgi:hypothetical protein
LTTASTYSLTLARSARVEASEASSAARGVWEVEPEAAADWLEEEVEGVGRMALREEVWEMEVGRGRKEQYSFWVMPMGELKRGGAKNEWLSAAGPKGEAMIKERGRIRTTPSLGRQVRQRFPRT